MNNDIKWTPGPWFVPHIAVDRVKCNCRTVLSEARFGGICGIHVDNEKRVSDGGNDAPPLEEAKANAHLIAASPSMADALMQWRNAEMAGDAEELANARKARDRALAQAVGEQR